MKSTVFKSKLMTYQLIEELSHLLGSIDSHGSIEIIVQDSAVTQITVRNIHKTNHNRNLMRSNQIQNI
jgi:hypothetical protein